MMDSVSTPPRHRRPSAAARRAAALQGASGGEAALAAGATGARRDTAAARTPPLAAEDALIVLWVLFGSRLVAMLPAFDAESGLGPGHLFAVAGMMFVEPSIAGFVAVAGALGLGGWLVAGSMLFAFWTRGPEDVDLDTAILRRFLFLGPAYWIIGPVAIAINLARAGVAHLFARLAGRDPSRIEVPTGWPGVPLPSTVRRLGVLPAILGGEWAFRSGLGGVAEAVTLDAGGIGTIAGALVVTVPAYLIFVVAPRLATGAVLAVSPWVLRFALYFAAVFAGDHWLGRLLG
jgi:hypothetical protein